MKENEVNVFWFRRDLRLKDNTALFKALSSGKEILPIFIFDKNIIDQLQDRNDHRVSFIHECLEDINQTLIENGSSLKTFYDTPENVFSQLLEKYNVLKVYANKDYEPYARARDERIGDYLKSKNANLHLYKDHVIFEEAEIVKKDGLPYTVFTPYKRKWLENLDLLTHLTECSSRQNIDNFIKCKASHITSLESMNFGKSALKAPKLDFDREVIENYNNTRDIPSIKRGTSRLGVHLRFGTISIRELTKKSLSLNTTYLSELIWREFYSQILANFPHVASSCFRAKYEAVKWINDLCDFDKWKNGNTGYPMVDAGMRELNETGHMHNRVRMVTASFLTKHLLIDYRWGESYFAQKLFDFDLSSNNGGWQWAAGCGTDAAPYFRIFNPTSQLIKFDKDLKYTKKWVPEYGTFDYAAPMVDHKAARERCLHTYKVALQ